MKHFIRRALVLGTAVLTLSCGAAFAAEEQPTIAVQLDGQNLTFTDAVPQVKDERTFLPFRAVVEAMNAEVEWSADAPDAIVAKRGDTTVSMILGSTAATVERDGVTTQIDMGVAPYSVADANGVWRTYVPVRFMAEAFDCAVGWDQDAYTAIIVDTGKLVAEAAQGKSFTYLEKFNDYSKKYSQGIWDCQMTMDGAVSMLGAEMPLSVAAQGTTEGETKVEMGMNMKLDMSQLITLLEQMTGETADMEPGERDMLDALANKGIDMKVLGDIGKGMIYMNMAGDILESAGMSADTWYSMDMNALLADSGMDLAELIKQSEKMDYEAVTKLFLNTLTLNDAGSEGPGTSYEVFKSSAENLVCALSDEGFIKDGDKYVSSIDGGLNKMELSFTMENGAVVAYDMIVNMTMEEDGTVVTVLVDMGVDKNDELSGKIKLDMSPLMAMDLDITGGYTQGKTAPVTEPPAGAAVIPYEQLMNAAIGQAQ